MILVDAGPLVALFDPRDKWHSRVRRVLQSLDGPVCTTLPVLTESFYMLGPASAGAARLRDYIERGAIDVWQSSRADRTRMFELMEAYADQEMDLADASLVVAAETLPAHRIFTLDRNDFETYRIRRGHQYHSFEIVS